MKHNTPIAKLMDKNDDRVYETLEIFYPQTYTGLDTRVTKKVVMAVEQYFSFASNVEIRNVVINFDDSMRNEIFLEARAVINNSDSLMHIVYLNKYLSPEDLIEIYNIVNKSGSNIGENAPLQGGVVTQDKSIPGYLYKSVANTPLVLNNHEMKSIDLIARSIENRDKIFDTYGLTSVLDTKSMCFLFYGPSGTGKTQAAKAIAKRVGKSLLIVDHSKLIDKYVGETEKAIDRVFDYAEENDCIILFDEADSLIGARTGKEQPWDISKVNTLLQGMEKSNATSIFATNFAEHLDSAVNRRLLSKVHFGLPDEKSRRAIWKALIPKNAPRDRISYKELARLELTGGEIKNAIVLTIMKAADTEAKLTTANLKEAANEIIGERIVDLFRAEKIKKSKSAGIGFQSNIITKKHLE